MAIDIISTSLAVAYSDGNKEQIEASPRDILSNLVSISCFRWHVMEPRI